jgi:hypothetical protein
MVQQGGRERVMDYIRRVLGGWIYTAFKDEKLRLRGVREISSKPERQLIRGTIDPQFEIK